VDVETSVLVAVESAQMREALVAMLSALHGFRIAAEADSDEAAVEAARTHRPHLALIEADLSGCGGWWAIHQIQAEQLAGAIVAMGRRADNGLTRLAGAQSYVQIGASPRDLLRALEAATAFRKSSSAGSGAEAQGHLLPDADAVL
jgi:DNA-binding NarL/FixJ family response regulator